MNKPIKFVILGAGPAGSSAAIRLASRGHRVTLIEKERFPREKLCGEFISPECFRHFEELGVKTDLFAKGGSRLSETRFYSAGGRSVSIPTSWFGSGDFALGLSRAQMDATLLERARNVGSEVLEGTRVVDIGLADGNIPSITVKREAGERVEIAADAVVDATGRSAVVSKIVEKKLGGSDLRRKAGLVAFKNHLNGARPENGVCEIYSFKGGYGGLSQIERGMSNLCFIVRADVSKELIGHTNNAVDAIMTGNRRAASTLGDAVAVGEWLAVPIAEFGQKRRLDILNLFSVGDAGAFIDPFTGSGMLMAMESAELLAKCVEVSSTDVAAARASYERAHSKIFKQRLRLSGLVRRTAFEPNLAAGAIWLAGINSRFRHLLARSTRSGSNAADRAA